MRDLDVIVVGAGIGGLTAAIALQRTGHRVRVLDQVRELRPIGAGISLWSNGVKVLDALGLGAEVAAAGGQMERMGYRDKHGTTLCEFSLEPLVERVGEHPYPCVAPTCSRCCSTRVGPEASCAPGRAASASTTTATRVVVLLEGGERLEADLVVAADGTHSRLRATWSGTRPSAIYLGYQNWNGLVADELALGDPDHLDDARR